MEIRDSGKKSAEQVHPARLSNSSFRIVHLILFVLAGCGAPGEPQPPQPPIPAAITDLSAQQSGDGVALIFTPPRNSLSGQNLGEPPAVEILRGSRQADGSPDEKSFRLVYTIPGALLETYEQDGRVRFLDPISPEEIRAHLGEILVYRIRTRVSKKRASLDSNTVTVPIFSVPERISQIEARVTETAVELSWPEPTRTSAGEPAPSISGYRIYRGELDPASAEEAQRDLSKVHWKKPLALLASSATNRFPDAQFDFGTTYAYVVRSVVVVGGTTIESGESSPVVVTPRDTFPPAPPQGLVAIFLISGEPPTSHVELSWSMNVETDLAGYHVYRSEQEGVPSQLVTPDLLSAPAYHDMSVEVGRHYWYSVTAVDRAGNESAPSAAVAVEAAQPSSR